MAINKWSRALVVSRLKQKQFVWACGAKIRTTLQNLSSIFIQSRLLPRVHVPHVDAAEPKYCLTCKKQTFINYKLDFKYDYLIFLLRELVSKISQNSIIFCLQKLVL